MSIRNKSLVNKVLIGSTDTAIYTIPTSLIRSIIIQARVINVGVSPTTLNLWVLQPTDIVGLPTLVIKDRVIAVSETIILDAIINEVIDNGGSIHATASLINSLYFSSSGLEVTN